jgi:hypothetical protein
MSSTSNRSWRALAGLALSAGLTAAPAWAAPDLPDREPVTLSVVAVNPSADQTKVVPVKIDLPQEVTPKDILETGELELEFDEARGAYYVFKDAVALGPKETRVFEVTVRDVWVVPQRELDSLKDYTGLLLSRLEKSDYYQTAKPLAENIVSRIDGITATQNDETLSRKSRIGAYRHHVQMVATIKEDLARMEKLLTFTGGPPVPEMLEESPLKSDAPSTTTTWLVIFLILIFVGLLAALFFFTWNRRMQVTEDLNVVRQAAFPGAKPEQGGVPAPKNGNGSGSR